MLTPITFQKQFLLFILFLVACYANVAFAAWDPHKVLGSVECGECHEDEFDIWKKSKHQKSYKKFSRNKDTKKIAKRLKVKRVKKTDSRCTKCHYTVGIKRKKVRVVSGVSCESCHTPSKDWFKIHNDYGGKGVKKEQETAAHKKQRFAKLDELGLIRSKHLYDWAYNCYQCHIIDDEELVNVGEHSSGNDFNLLKYSQDEILHSPKADAKKRKLIDKVGQAMAIQFSLRALSDADDVNSQYGKKLKARYDKALAKLEEINNEENNPDIGKIIKLAKKVNVGSSGSLRKASDSIEKLTIKISGSGNIIKDPAVSIAAAEPPKVKKKKQIEAAKKEPVERKKKVEPKVEKPAPAVAPPPPPKAATKVERVVEKPEPRVGPKPKKAQPIDREIDQSDRRVDKRTPSSGQLIKSVELIAPSHSPLCVTQTPWLMGEKKISRKSSITDNGCFSVKILANDAASIQIYATSKSRRLYKLFPNACVGNSLKSDRVKPLVSSVFPMDEDQRSSTFLLSPDFQPYEVYVLSSVSSIDLDRLSKEVSPNSSCINNGVADLGSQSNFSSTLKRIRRDKKLDYQWSRHKIKISN